MSKIEHHKAAQAYWQSLEHLADTPEVRQRIEQEFVGYDPTGLLKDTNLSRRRFMKVMGASMALAGVTLTGCRRWPEEVLAPFTVRPEGRIPGVPELYATMHEDGGVATGLLAQSYDGRPIKVEGNPFHPFSLGAASNVHQASVLSMYDPQRSRAPARREGRDTKGADWPTFQQVADPLWAQVRQAGGAGFAILVQPTASPTVQRLKARIRQAMPQSRWYEYEAVNRDNEILGTQLAFGRPLRPVMHLDKARIIACFDCDLLSAHPAHLRYARDWAAGRYSADAPAGQATMNRMYVAESTYTPTGSVADERLAVRASRIDRIVRALANRLGVQVPGGEGEGAAPLTEREQAFIEHLAADLQAHRGAAALSAGRSQPASVHAVVHAINVALGAPGSTVTYVPEIEEQGAQQYVPSVQQIRELALSIARGEVQTLLILGGNPVYDAPADLELASLIYKVPNSIHLSDYLDETSVACLWHLNKAHALESWGDGRAWDGTLSIQQPIILPLFGGHTPAEVLAMVLGDRAPLGYELVRETFAALLPRETFENSWRQALQDGVVQNSGHAPVTPTVQDLAGLPAPREVPGEFEVVFVPDANLHDGRYANNGWLQEAPRPLTKLVWDNAALISKVDADRLGIESGRMLRLTVAGRTLAIPALILPGQPRGSITLPLGYGHKAMGSIAREVGFDTYRLRGTDTMEVGPVAVERTGETYELVTTQDQYVLLDAIGQHGYANRVGEKHESGRIIREATLAEYQADRNIVRRSEHGNFTLQLWDPPHTFADPHAWGMSIDMNACIGCNACVIACQAENNIPVVGKEQVAMNREMHWLRVDRYFKHDEVADPGIEHPDVVHQVMLCQHCENAPCETVCPVAATVHDSEGLNTMVYNRCIGTRYCSNNCPYKVRRFNYFDWHAKDPRAAVANPYFKLPDMQQREQIDPIRQMEFNPEVTVRMRGVMEKCTYCVQRLMMAKIEAKNEWTKGRRASPLVQPGEVLTACQQTCPTQAIKFGDLKPANNQALPEPWDVYVQQQSPRAYSVLGDYNTRPRTKYLAKLRNPAVEPVRPAAGRDAH